MTHFGFNKSTSFIWKMLIFGRLLLNLGVASTGRKSSNWDLVFLNLLFCTVNGKFSSSTCYEALLGNIFILPGYKQIWCNLALPKHKFIFWLTVQYKLLTRDILALGYLLRSLWLAQENHHHLFFNYNFSKMVFGTIKAWVGPLGLDMDLENWEHWFLNLKLSEFTSVAKVVILQALVYVIWSNSASSPSLV